MKHMSWVMSVGEEGTRWVNAVSEPKADEAPPRTEPDKKVAPKRRGVLGWAANALKKLVGPSKRE